MADACSRCNGRGTPWGCKSCGKKVPQTLVEIKLALNSKYGKKMQEDNSY